jgi:hypothetical protein
MKAFTHSHNPHRPVACPTCPACVTHSRPLEVPWEQHVIGCPVRTAVLQRDRATAIRMREAVGVA